MAGEETDEVLSGDKHTLMFCVPLFYYKSKYCFYYLQLVKLFYKQVVYTFSMIF